MRKITGAKPVDENVLPFPRSLDQVSLAKRLKQLITARRTRERFLPPELFADPAWDMLLEAYLARLEQRRISVSGLGFAARVPPTTAIRWVRKLEDEALFVRVPDPFDQRRFWIELSPDGTSLMTRYLRAVSDVVPT
jgi:hypothetical protein